MKARRKKDKKPPNVDILAPDGSIEARICTDCGETKPITEYQRTMREGQWATDCKACRYRKMNAGIANRKATQVVPATKEWVIAQATLLYDRAFKDSDKAKYLDLISRNLNGDAKNLTDDAKVLRDLIASKKRLREETHNP